MGTLNATWSASSITQISGPIRDLYQDDGVGATVNFDHIKRHYDVTQEEISPTRIVPIGPMLELDKPHGRRPRP